MSFMATRRSRVQVKMATLSWLFLILFGTQSTNNTPVTAYSSSLSHSTTTTTTTTRSRRHRPFQKTTSFQSSSLSPADDYTDFGGGNTDGKDSWKSVAAATIVTTTATARAFDAAVRNRFACKAFLRFDQRRRNADDAAVLQESGENATNATTTTTTTTAASIADPFIVARAMECLEIARLTPSAFNTQPYKVVLVHSPAQKLALSKYCLGPNAKRVLDSDCTAVFLADRKVLQTLPRFGRFMASMDAQGRSPTLLTKVYITLFSSGYPFMPRILASTISFLVRTGVSFFSIFTTALFQYPLPTLSSAETWSCKQTTMLAMTYMLACSSRGLATIPMEGINAGGVRAVVGAPHRYAVPVIVSTGLPLHDNNKDVDDDKQRRYPLNEMVFGDAFNQQMQITGAAAST